MANTTSGTTIFEKGFSIADIVEEAYERIGISGVSGYQLKGARRSLNIMFQEWANRGLHYWEVANNSITLVNNQSVYTMYRSTTDGTSSATAVYGVDDILEASYRNASNIDTPLTKINRSTYQALSNKTSTGNPTQYFVQRFIDKITVTLYLTVKYAPDRIQMLKMLYEDELNRALQEDGSSSSSFITPKTYYPSI